VTISFCAMSTKLLKMRPLVVRLAWGSTLAAVSLRTFRSQRVFLAFSGVPSEVAFAMERTHIV